MCPRIAKIIVTARCNDLNIGQTYNVAPTPFYAKAYNQNGRFGVWIFDGKEVVFVPFLAFLVVEYRYNPNPQTYGFVPSHKHITGWAAWGTYFNRVYFLKLRSEYWNLK